MPLTFSACFDKSGRGPVRGIVIFLCWPLLADKCHNCGHLISALSLVIWWGKPKKNKEESIQVAIVLTCRYCFYILMVSKLYTFYSPRRRETAKNMYIYIVNSQPSGTSRWNFLEYKTLATPTIIIITLNLGTVVVNKIFHSVFVPMI